MAAVGAVAVVLLATSCAESEEGASASRADIANAEQTTTTTNPYAVPPVIDAAYVNRVLAGLDAAVGDVVRLFVKEKGPSTEALDRLKALYTDDPLSLQLEVFRLDAASNFEGYFPDPGNQTTTVTELVTATPECIFAHVSHDFSRVVKNPKPELSDQWVALVRLDPARDPHQYNSTGWSYVYDGFESDRRMPDNPCEDS